MIHSALVYTLFLCIVISLNAHQFQIPTQWMTLNITDVWSIITKKSFGQPKAFRISYINGIYHTEDDWASITDVLEQIFKTKVRPFYLPSSGSWAQDLTSAGYALIFKPKDIEIARNLTTHLRVLLDEIKPNGRVLHIAHSAGAIITYLAAKYHLTTAEKERIDVITFGGGRSITKKYFPGKLVNYYAQNDPLVLVDSRAGKLIKKGAKSMMSFFRKYSKKVTSNNGSSSSSSNSTKYKSKDAIHKLDTYQDIDNILNDMNITDINELERREIRDHKHNTPFVFLKAKAKDFIVDHSLDGPTYHDALVKEAESFHHKLKILVTEEAYNNSLTRRIRKTCAKVTGYHHYWKKRKEDELLRQQQRQEKQQQQDDDIMNNNNNNNSDEIHSSTGSSTISTSTSSIMKDNIDDTTIIVDDDDMILDDLNTMSMMTSDSVNDINVTITQSIPSTTSHIHTSFFGNIRNFFVKMTGSTTPLSTTISTNVSASASITNDVSDNTTTTILSDDNTFLNDINVMNITQEDIMDLNMTIYDSIDISNSTTLLSKTSNNSYLRNIRKLFAKITGRRHYWNQNTSKIKVTFPLPISNSDSDSDSDKSDIQVGMNSSNMTSMTMTLGYEDISGSNMDTDDMTLLEYVTVTNTSETTTTTTINSTTTTINSTTTILSEGNITDSTVEDNVNSSDLKKDSNSISMNNKIPEKTKRFKWLFS